MIYVVVFVDVNVWWNS